MSLFTPSKDPDLLHPPFLATPTLCCRGAVGVYIRSPDEGWSGTLESISTAFLAAWCVACHPFPCRFCSYLLFCWTIGFARDECVEFARAVFLAASGAFRPSPLCEVMGRDRVNTPHPGLLREILR